jgi:peptidoglycan/xylan/chitin deacetylase (PgdA/CDA1 family)
VALRLLDHPGRERRAARMTLKTLKRAFLQAAKGAGLFQLVGSGRWRRNRLLILCYHGVSIDDEHEWNPALYISQADFVRRLTMLEETGCNMVSLDGGLRALRTGELPPRAVAVTFDDGYFDFYSRAYPLLEAAGIPVTVYLATLRCDNNRPVFNLMAPYVLWTARGRAVDVSDVVGPDARFDLRSAAGRARAFAQLQQAVTGRGPARKDELLATVAGRLGVDYDALRKKRLLSIMNPGEVAQLAAAGVHFELHTHTHRTPTDRDVFHEEIRKNVGRIQEITGVTPVHFCYPSGLYRPQFLAWLTECDVISATTCDSGLATARTHPMLLPRLVDTRAVTEIEFEGWLSGVASVTVRRRWHPEGHADATD